MIRLWRWLMGRMNDEGGRMNLPSESRIILWMAGGSCRVLEVGG